MFNLVNIGERAGSGIPNIYSVWEKQGWKLPELSESYDPDRITLSLAIEKTSDKKQAIKTSDKNITEKQSRIIVDYLADHIQASASELAQVLGLSPVRTRAILKKMVDGGVVAIEGGNRNRIYKLK